MLLRPPSAVNWEPPTYDHICTTLPFWSCATTPGESTARSVGTWLIEGSSASSWEVMTVPDVAEVVSISGVADVTTTVSDLEPTSSETSISLSSAVCRAIPVICGLESGRSHGELIRAGQQELDNPVPLSVGLGLPCDAGII